MIADGVKLFCDTFGNLILIVIMYISGVGWLYLAKLEWSLTYSMKRKRTEMISSENYMCYGTEPNFPLM